MNVSAAAGCARLTFILPVLNRAKVIARAIDSCLQCKSGMVAPHVLVIDGGSTDGTLEIIQSRYYHNPDVELICQSADRPGFMNACYMGVEHLGDGLATFMYSDDVLSPWFVVLADALATSADVDLAFGYGQQAPEGVPLEFKPADPMRLVNAEKVLQAFYGDITGLDGKSPPVSPVCCITRSQVLRTWVNCVQDFVGDNSLRRHAMVKLAGGQDLMIYLVPLVEGKGRVFVTRSVVAQLTASRESITNSGNRAGQLLVGYWYARLWGLNRLLEKGHARRAVPLAGYVLAVWLYITGRLLLRRDLLWWPSLVWEIRVLVAALVKHGIFIRSCFAVLRSGWLRLQMRYKGS